MLFPLYAGFRSRKYGASQLLSHVSITGLRDLSLAFLIAVNKYGGREHDAAINDHVHVGHMFHLRIDTEFFHDFLNFVICECYHI